MDHLSPSAVSASSAPLGQLLSMEPTGADRRRHPRYQCDGSAEVFVPHGALLFEGRILNLSLSGCFVETPELDLERGTHVEVSFSTCQMHFRLAGHIAILRRKRGAGIVFDSVSERRARQILELVQELREATEAESKASGVDR